jgi:hypothetical protein
MLKAIAISPMANWLGFRAQLASATISPALDASLHYRRAFSELAKLTEVDKALVAEWKTVPLNKAVNGLLRRFTPALSDLHSGAMTKRCGWAEITDMRDLGSGDNNIGNLGIGKIALLRARRLVEAGRSWEALDDIFAAASFGRHFGHAGILISRIYQFSMENQAIAALAAILPRLDPRALASIPARVASLPAPCSWTETMRLEGRFIAVTVAQKMEALESPIGLEELASVHLEEAEAKVILERTGGDRDRIVALVWNVVPYLASLAEVLELPRGSFARALESFKDRTGGINPFAASVVRWVGDMRFAADRTELLWTMVLAARTLIVEGFDSFRAITDPFGDGPFLYRKSADGFELQSALHREGKPPAVVRVGSLGS